MAFGKTEDKIIFNHSSVKVDFLQLTIVLKEFSVIYDFHMKVSI